MCPSLLCQMLQNKPFPCAGEDPCIRTRSRRLRLEAWSCYTLKIKALNWHLWFHEEPATSMEHKVLYCGKRFFRLLNCSLNSSLKGSLGNPEWFFYGIAAKTPIWKCYFKSVNKAFSTVPILQLNDVKGSIFLPFDMLYLV